MIARKGDFSAKIPILNFQYLLPHPYSFFKIILNIWSEDLGIDSKPVINFSQK